MLKSRFNPVQILLVILCTVLTAISCGKAEEMNPFAGEKEDPSPSSSPISGGYSGLYLTKSGDSKSTSLKLSDKFIEISFIRPNGSKATIIGAYKIFSETKMFITVTSSDEFSLAKVGEKIVANYELTEKTLTISFKNTQFMLEKNETSDTGRNPPTGNKQEAIEGNWICEDHNGNKWNFAISKIKFEGVLASNQTFLMKGSVSKAKTESPLLTVRSCTSDKYIGYQFTGSIDENQMILSGVSNNNNPTEAELICDK